MFLSTSSIKSSWPRKSGSSKAGSFWSMKGQDILSEKLIDPGPDDSNENKKASLHVEVHNPPRLTNRLKSARDVASQMTELLSQEFEFRNSTGPGCVVVVGSTGTGKSSTIGKVTRNRVLSGNGKDRVTIGCATYKLKSADTDFDRGLTPEMKELVWVDTVGWDDADLQDDSTFKDILRFIGNEQLLRVKAVIWCILPNIRKDALLTKQARLIDMFKPREIWTNVIIVCKQSRNPEDDSQGAISAARTLNPNAEIPILGYTYIDDPSLTANQRKQYQQNNSLRDDFLVKTDDEVRRCIIKAVQNISGDPIPVVFRNQRCIDCGATNDIRLMPSNCHMEKILVHPGNVVQFHPKKIEKYHDSTSITKEHPGGLYRPWFSCDILFCKFGGDRYICCKALNGQPGCQTVRTCCGRPFHDGDDKITGCQERFACCKVNITSKVTGCKSRYECCGRRVKSLGCQEKCKKCDRPWGSDAADCFEKEHNTVKLE